ncbi:MAG: DUF4242 domain-containing protein [Planctomycetes bacterium]|nr:DUF4242 domain-containing protein [Planctomycetota bacterium]
MIFERSFVNLQEGVCVCCWHAPSRDDLALHFQQAGTPFQEMVQVQEFAGEAAFA